MKLFSLLWILPVTLGDAQVTCIYSEECMLPCTSTHLDIIHWYFDGKVVHSFYHNESQLGHQHKDYEGRTSLLSKSEIKNGNVSLLIRNIRVQDEGRYRCYAADDNTNDEKYVAVSVKAPAKSVDIALINDTVICSCSGVYPEPTVSWSSDPPAMEPPKTTVRRTEDHLFTVTSQLKVNVITDTYTYNCSVITTKDTRYTASLKEEGVETTSKTISITVAIISIIIIIIIIIILIVKRKTLSKILLRCKKTSRTKNTGPANEEEKLNGTELSQMNNKLKYNEED